MEIKKVCFTRSLWCFVDGNCNYRYVHCQLLIIAHSGHKRWVLSFSQRIQMPAFLCLRSCLACHNHTYCVSAWFSISWFENILACTSVLTKQWHENSTKGVCVCVREMYCNNCGKLWALLMRPRTKSSHELSPIRYLYGIKKKPNQISLWDTKRNRR